MKPDYDSLINAGLSKEEIAKISGCEDQEMQIRMLRKYRYKLLDEVHEKQQTQKDNFTEQKKGINCKILVEEKA